MAKPHSKPRYFCGKVAAEARTTMSEPPHFLNLPEALVGAGSLYECLQDPAYGKNLDAMIAVQTSECATMISVVGARTTSSQFATLIGVTRDESMTTEAERLYDQVVTQFR